MATFTPAAIIGDYGVGIATPGDTIDPSLLPAAAAAAFSALTGAPGDNPALASALAGKETAGAAAAAQAACATAAQGALATSALQPSAAAALYAPLYIVTRIVPTTGQTRTWNTLGKDELITLKHTGTIAAQTFVWPTDANSRIGQVLRIQSKAAVTTLTHTLNGNTLDLTVTTIPAAGNLAWMKSAANEWTRIQ